MIGFLRKFSVANCEMVNAVAGDIKAIQIRAQENEGIGRAGCKVAYSTNI